ncbi:MAG TPA: PAS domain-containing protein, partial [Candidatus Binatia bacterium]|nr:PAS domain-containing protein [Candidatus Binatia bacterium]
MDGGTPTALERRLPGGGEMGARVRAFDWSRTSLGPIACWPDALVAAVRLALDSRYAMFVWWGEDLIQFYNDAYIPILGARHPDALGRPASETWRDIWDTVGVLAATVLREGRGTWSEELLLVMHRHGYPEEAYFTFSYSPVRAADGTVAGVFCAVTEDTRRILGERRLATLGALAQATARVRTVDEVCTLAAGVLDGNRRDLPFAAIYLFDDQGRRARLAAAAGIPPGTRPAPEQIDVADETWPMAAVLARGEMVVLDDAAARFGPLPG